MPPPNLQVKVAGVSVTGKNFTLTATNKTITGTIVDSNGTGVSNAGVFSVVHQKLLLVVQLLVLEQGDRLILVVLSLLMLLGCLSLWSL